MDRKNLKTVIFLSCCCILSLLSCTKDKPGKPDNKIPDAANRKVLIACEGSLGNGNASLSVYLPVKDSVYQDVYTTANGAAMGDIFQSITLIGNHYFFCVNNSDQVIVVNPDNWLESAVISIPKPRYILQAGSGKAYVSTLFSNDIYIINTVSFAVTGKISMPFTNAEQMILSGTDAYVCSWDTASNHIYRIDTRTDKISDSIAIAGYAPQSILTDKNNKAWVLAGNPVKNRTTTLHQIDLSAGKVLKSFTFGKKVEVIKPVFNPGGDTLYYIEVNYDGGTKDNGIFRMHSSDALLPATPLISCATYQYFWALGIDPVNGDIYVGDPKGFIQNGAVMIYDNRGNLKTQVKTGLGPGFFYFN